MSRDTDAQQNFKSASVNFVILFCKFDHGAPNWNKAGWMEKK